MAIREHRYADPSHWCAAAAARIAWLLDAAVAERNRASLMLSGGNTPAPVLRALKNAPVDWPKITVSLVDERLVPPDHADSNQRLVTDTLDPEGLGARFLPLYSPAASPQAAAEAATRRLATLPLPLDIVLLGMGDDGHTASLFAGAPEFETALSSDAPICVCVNPPAAPHTRLSLSLPALLAARHPLLLISGARKWSVYQESRRRDDPDKLPVSALLHRATHDIELYWHA